ncbi:MAG TPA: aspartate-semialdehyde dehydrogenase [Myxococcales bacterium]|jgi:aspartate-semialdehyde dehydrogenase|nr:aspartate-semialdehyde dehydrogenase [Myxococcales bacterium]
MAHGYKVAILGATGTVGRELINLLEERDFPIESLTLLASPKSEGMKLEFRGEELTVRAVAPEHFEGVQLALLSAGAAASLQWAPVAAAKGAIVIDNSSAFRMEDDVPLIVPEVNPKAVSMAKNRGVIANPNCSTIQMVVVLKPLHDAAKLRRVVVSTYQSVSGKGQKGIEELEKQVSDLMNARETEAKAFPHRIAFNVLPHIDAFLDNGYTKEEMKMVDETRKILGDPSLAVSATCVRVPVFLGHSEAINATFEKKLTAQQARELLKEAPGVKVLDDPATNVYPMPMLAVGDDATHVGRIREDLSQPNGLELFVCADNLRKGAAANAVQIAELLVEKRLVQRS